mgnify:CR=1 FL=1|tara:strand:+ start:1262 stop:3640 length:2379 start_codon:yes stop_codon:yes gene_type:complete
MIKLILNIIFLISLSFCQIQYEGIPKYFNSRIDNLVSLSTEQSSIIDTDFDPMVFKYGDEYNFDVNILESSLVISDDQEVTYLLGIQSRGAFGIGINFSQFFLSENAKLYIYDFEQTYYIGSFTSLNNKDSEVLSTSIVKSDHVIIELTVPRNEIKNIKLHTNSIIHDSTDILNYYNNSSSNSREDCNINVICSEGDDWRDQINGAVRVSMGAGLCSASIINNTENDRTPYVLFADHCVSGSPNNYVVYFNYQSTSCNGTSGSLNQSISGTNLLYQEDINSGADIALLRLTSDIPDSYNPYYVGWSVSSSPPNEAIGIHHPGGDIKKISFTNDNVSAGGSGANYWEFQYDLGRVIPGSSGSPFFNEDKRQVGVASYIYTNYCDPSPDCYCDQQYSHGYGRIDRAWSGLSNYLDPLNSGVLSIDGISNSGINIVHDSYEDIPYDNQNSLLFTANVTSYSGQVDGVELHYNLGDSWQVQSMPRLGFGSIYETSIEGLYNGMLIDYYILAVNSDGIIQTYPNSAPSNSILFILGDLPDLYANEFEIDGSDWVIGDSSDTATSGIWNLDIPQASFNDQGLQVQPGLDHTENGQVCFFTGSGYELDPSTGQNNASFDDVDGGSTTLFSPTFNLLSVDKAILTYWRWYTNNIGDNGNNDKWVVSVSNNGGASWIDLENTSISNASWVKQRFLLNDHINLTSDIIFKFVAEDVFNTGDAGSGGSLVEAAIDDFLIEYITSGSGIVGDINNDEAVDVLDIVVLVNMVLGFESSNFQVADINSDGSVNIQDIILVVNIILN